MRDVRKEEPYWIVYRGTEMFQKTISGELMSPLQTI